MKSAIARIKGLVFHFLEIPKYTKSPKKRIRDMTKMERWLAYFANQLIPS